MNLAIDRIISLKMSATEFKEAADKVQEVLGYTFIHDDLLKF